MDKSEISPRFENQLSHQTYERTKDITGVRLIEFNMFTDDGGDFHEIARIEKNRANLLDGFEIRQINRSRFNPGLVKAFHLHLKQDEIWAVHPLDRLLVGLFDARKGSPTEGVIMRLVLGGGKCKFLYIPKGVAHGAMNLDRNPIDVVYLVNEHFSSQDPDEWRLPWDTLGREFWEIQKG